MSSNKHKKSTNIPIGDGLRSSLESLQASLDEWVAVENKIDTNSSGGDIESAPTHKSDKDLLSKLAQQIEKLS